MFQFLIGRLKTIDGHTIVDLFNPFQFLIGRLKTNLPCSNLGTFAGFNSL